MSQGFLAKQVGILHKTKLSDEELTQKKVIFLGQSSDVRRSVRVSLQTKMLYFLITTLMYKFTRKKIVTVKL